MRTPDAAEAAFLRMIEIMEAHVPFLDVASEREALAAKYAEVRPTAIAARDVLKEELANGNA